MKFRSKIVEIDAVKWTGENDHELNIFVTGSSLVWSSDHAPCISTDEGVMRANVGDWIIRGTEGEFYPCRDSVFQAKYESAEAVAP